MRKVTIIAAIFLALTACSTLPQAPADRPEWAVEAKQIVNPDQASVYYDILSDVYETTMKELVRLRAAGEIDDETWNETIVPLRDQIGNKGISLGRTIQRWRSTEARALFDAAFDELVELILRLSEVKQWTA